MILFLTALTAGVLTPLAPCILPLLPVVVGSSTLGRRSAYTVIASLGVSVVVFTLLLKVSTAFISVPESVWTYFSAAVIIFFGLTLAFPSLWESIPLAGANARALRLMTRGQGPWRSIVMGAALGPVFTTCSPTYFIVLATVLPENFALGFLYLLAYTSGLCAMLLAIGLLGERLVGRLGGFSDPHHALRRSLGIVFIAVGIIVGFGYDKKIQLTLLDAGLYDVTRIEQWLLGAHKEALPVLNEVIYDETLRIARKEEFFKRAPEINSPAGFVNSGPITLEQFRGKNVVLLDIWTYSCINCQRTIPYLNAWHSAYQKDGLQIIGLHTPEFAFEKDIDNVRWAVEQFGIEYPTVLDNDYATWKALGNNYWPRKYLIDIDGFIVYDHIGEGAYEETEIAIQQALMERAALLGERTQSRGIVSSSFDEERRSRHSPEVYFGALRNERLGNGIPGLSGTRSHNIPQIVERNTLYLDGVWSIRDEYAGAQAPARIRIDFEGKDVFMVASGDAVLKVLLDGMPVAEEAGSDVVNGELQLSTHRLYKLIEGDTPGHHTLEIEVQRGSLEAYSFTFG